MIGGRTRAAVLAAAAVVVAGVLAGCAPGDGPILATFPAGSLGPERTAGQAAAQTRIELVRVLGERNLVLRDTEAPFRPPEDVTFTTTPRAIYQVVLPNAPTEGFIVVYEFPDAAAAAEAAADQAAYLATGPARVQSAFGPARHARSWDRRSSSTRGCPKAPPRTRSSRTSSRPSRPWERGAVPG